MAVLKINSFNMSMGMSTELYFVPTESQADKLTDGPLTISLRVARNRKRRKLVKGRLTMLPYDNPINGNLDWEYIFVPNDPKKLFKIIL